MGMPWVGTSIIVRIYDFVGAHQRVLLVVAPRQPPSASLRLSVCTYHPTALHACMPACLHACMPEACLCFRLPFATLKTNVPILEMPYSINRGTEGYDLFAAACEALPAPDAGRNAPRPPPP